MSRRAVPLPRVLLSQSLWREQDCTCPESAVGAREFSRAEFSYTCTKELLLGRALLLRICNKLLTGCTLAPIRSGKFIRYAKYCVALREEALNCKIMN